MTDAYSLLYPQFIKKQGLLVGGTSFVVGIVVLFATGSRIVTVGEVSIAAFGFVFTLGVSIKIR